MGRNILVMGMDRANEPQLRRLEQQGTYRFHPLLSYEDVKLQARFVVADLLDRARRQVAAFPGTVDGIAGYWDFPVTSLVPILSRELGLPSPTLESVLACEHKYWGRLRHREVTDDVPAFAAVDPFEGGAGAELPLPPPVWVKPVKSFASQLAFRAGDRRQYRSALAEIAAGIGRLAEPFGEVLALADLPAEVARVSAHHCLVEQAVGGRQCTVEGYATGTEVRAYGVVDSVRFPNRPSFQRYQYPSRLPRAVQERVTALAVAAVEHVGLRWSPFNVEFFYDERRDRTWLLEINPRLSQSHSELFEHVDGLSHFAVMAALAVGEEPVLPRREGRHAVAAKLFVRSFLPDGMVVSAPSRDDLDRLVSSLPGSAHVELQVRPGVLLSGLHDQDAYSWQLAHVVVGARTNHELLTIYRSCVDYLRETLVVERAGPAPPSEAIADAPPVEPAEPVGELAGAAQEAPSP